MGLKDRIYDGGVWGCVGGWGGEGGTTRFSNQMAWVVVGDRTEEEGILPCNTHSLPFSCQYNLPC
jgi:hypothetical protein